MFNAKNGSAELPSGVQDYVRFGRGAETLVMIPGVERVLLRGPRMGGEGEGARRQADGEEQGGHFSHGSHVFPPLRRRALSARGGGRGAPAVQYTPPRARGKAAKGKKKGRRKAVPGSRVKGTARRMSQKNRPY